MEITTSVKNAQINVVNAYSLVHVPNAVIIVSFFRLIILVLFSVLTVNMEIQKLDSAKFVNLLALVV